MLQTILQRADKIDRVLNLGKPCMLQTNLQRTDEIENVL